MEEELGRILGVSNSQTGLNLRPRDTDGEFSEPTIKRCKRNAGFEKGSKKNQGAKLSKWQIIQGKVFQQLERTAICPLESIKSQPEFLEDDWLTDPDNQTKVNKAIEIWSHKINVWTLDDFAKFYGKREGFVHTQVFLDEERDFERNYVFSKSKKYMNEQESFKVLDRLLMYQFDGDENMIRSFLQHLVNVVDFQPEDNPFNDPKCNTFLVFSAPSAGKNFFFDTLFTLLLNMGQLGIANRHNNFAFQDAAHRRIILWNEPNYESSCTDYLKTLFEGGDTKVRVKNMGDTHVKRTPIIVLTNRRVEFMGDLAFRDRVKQYTWKAAPFLKEYSLKPYPLTFFDILLKYEIKF